MKKIVVLMIVAIFSLTLYSTVQTESPVNAEPAESNIDGLVGWWKFNDSADSVADDSSSSDNGGTLNNMSAANYVEDVPAACSETNVNALSLNEGGQGDEEFISVGSHDELRPSSITVSAWIKASSESTSYAQIAGAAGLTKGVVGYSLSYSADYDSVEFLSWQGNVAVELVDGDSIEDQWAHVAATYNEATGDTYLYVNGSVVDSYDNDPAAMEHAPEFFENAPYDFQIGRSQLTDLQTNGFFEGLIDDVRVYNRALSDIEIEELSAAGDCEAQTEDLNGDNIDDSGQPNVGGYVSSMTNKIVAIDVGGDCELTVDDMTQESNLAVQDAAYEYTNGLWTWEADCVGESTTVKLYYYDVEAQGLIARKFSTSTNTYFTLTDAVIEETTINGSLVTVVTYSITDNSERDMNPEVGSIADPVGVGESLIGAPRTGGGGTALTFSRVGLNSDSFLP